MPEVWESLYSLRGGIKLGLERTFALLELLGNPHLKNPQGRPQIIHAAGTNGKGSTLITLEALLLAQGFSTGLSISPHLVHFTERFRVNGQPIENEILLAAFGQVCAVLGLDPTDPLKNWEGAVLNPSFFEMSVALAFITLHRQDYLLLETGLGGRLDATNVIQNPELLLLTPISIDHQNFLGSDLCGIAKEKLAIKKGKTPFLIGQQDPKIHETIKAELTDIPQLWYGMDFGWRGETYFFKDQSFHLPKIGLEGAHQKENIGLGLAAYFQLTAKEKWMTEAQLQTVVENLNWAGRLEWLTSNLLLDGAHNEAGMESLIQYLETHHGLKKIRLCLGLMEGKDILGPIKKTELNLELQPIDFNQVGAVSGEALFELLKSTGKACLAPIDLVDLDLEQQSPYDFTVIAGSLYLLGAFKTQFQ
ncbi:MAG: hypothetical protein QNL04_02205 [SAR324 cluster bacterium]|nr:hypothetical protein [SAR324 cluster bacterium]